MTSSDTFICLANAARAACAAGAEGSTGVFVGEAIVAVGCTVGVPGATDGAHAANNSASNRLKDVIVRVETRCSDILKNHLI